MHAESAVVGRRKGGKKKSLITIDGNKQFNQYKHCNFIDFYFIDFFLKQIVRNYTEWLLAIKDYSLQKTTQ